MTDAEESREEWVQERLAIMAANGLKFDERTARAEAILAWERLCSDMRRENAARRHGEGAGARGGDSVGGCGREAG